MGVSTCDTDGQLPHYVSVSQLLPVLPCSFKELPIKETSLFVHLD